jgi:hypothetical protein
MSKPMSHVFQQAIIRLLRPIVRLMIRQNIPLAQFVDLLKHVYVSIAKEELALPSKKLSDSRISVVTGIPRKDIKKYGHSPEVSDQDMAKSHNRAARVLTGWIQDQRYHHPKDHKPMDLDIELGDNEGPSFAQLVKTYSGGVPHKAVLDELMRIKAVVLSAEGQVRLVSYGYVPSTDDLQQMAVMSEEISDFLKCIEHNTTHAVEDSFLQLSARCDNLPAEIMNDIKNLGTDSGTKLLQEFVSFMSSYDRDQNDKVFGSGRHKAVLGVYYFQQDMSEDADEQAK